MVELMKNGRETDKISPYILFSSLFYEPLSFSSYYTRNNRFVILKRKVLLAFFYEQLSYITNHKMEIRILCDITEEILYQFFNVPMKFVKRKLQLINGYGLS